MERVEKFIIRWSEELMSISDSIINAAVNATRTESLDSAYYQYCAGMLVEPQVVSGNLEPMPEELFNSIKTKPVVDYVKKLSLLENNPNQELWMELAEFIDEYGY